MARSLHDGHRMVIIQPDGQAERAVGDLQDLLRPRAQFEYVLEFGALELEERDRLGHPGSLTDVLEERGTPAPIPGRRRRVEHDRVERDLVGRLIAQPGHGGDARTIGQAERRSGRRPPRRRVAPGADRSPVGWAGEGPSGGGSSRPCTPRGTTPVRASSAADRGGSRCSITSSPPWDARSRMGQGPGRGAVSDVRKPDGRGGRRAPARVPLESSIGRARRRHEARRDFGPGHAPPAVLDRESYQICIWSSNS